MGIFGDDPGIPAGSPYIGCGASYKTLMKLRHYLFQRPTHSKGGFGHPHPKKLQLVYLT